mmetsp:Transcript_105076/g.322074  ORF Transcript_105076/g.322074 Transcript_105076/m.322074 type:complete len:89 (-) Transcript_105076:119-385(-)
MQSIVNTQVLRGVAAALQTAFIACFIGVALMSLISMPPGQAHVSPGGAGGASKGDLCAQRTWFVLPVVFLCGGMVNLKGFGSASVLIL